MRQAGALVVTLVLSACASTSDRADVSAPATGAVDPVVPTSITLVATGDVLVHQSSTLTRSAASAGRASGVGYDFRPVFAELTPVISAADVAVCHLETPVAPPGGPFTGYPLFAAQPQILDALDAAGYDTCSTASNHSIDAGFDGVVRTLDALDARGIGHTGTFRTESESRTPHLLDVGGVRIAQIAWTFSLNGLREPADRPWLVNDFDGTDPQSPPDMAGVLADAAAARRAGADLVVASIHCCSEYDHDPAPAQRATAEALLGSPDVDLVLGHHAHVVQPVEMIAGKWVAYGLGNHLAQQRTPAAASDSVVARFTITRHPDGRVAVTAAEALPTRIRTDAAGVAIVRTYPGDPSFERVADVLGRRGGIEAGLRVVDR